MKEVFTTPEARPDSLGSTSLMAASSIGLNATPAPNPSRIMLGSTSVTKLPPTGARAKSTSPAPASSSPTVSGRLMPKRMTSLADRPSEHAERARGGPARRVPVHDRVHREHQRRGHGDRAGDVETPGAGARVRGRQQPQRQHADEDPDRQVDEKDPMPVERVREDAAEQH